MVALTYTRNDAAAYAAAGLPRAADVVTRTSSRYEYDAQVGRLAHSVLAQLAGPALTMTAAQRATAVEAAVRAFPHDPKFGRADKLPLPRFWTGVGVHDPVAAT